MPKDDILDELEEISQLVEGEEEKPVTEELEEIEKIAGAAAAQPKEEKKEEVTKEAEKEKEEKVEKPPEKKEVKEEKKPIPEPEKAIRGSGLKYASVILILIGLIIYGLAFYLRLNGWRIINYPPSSVVALVGTFLIIAGGEVYYRGLER